VFELCKGKGIVKHSSAVQGEESQRNVEPARNMEAVLCVQSVLNPLLLVRLQSSAKESLSIDTVLQAFIFSKRLEFLEHPADLFGEEDVFLGLCRVCHLKADLWLINIIND